ncbi:copper-binding protein [Ramlibacter rhizophilus]|uniref:Copper-binding protein n=1 Tax=Ramlibacter rhizophilus TaxID=1781167 RepID=A0A4Z0C2E4_9BURK|nr:copper-binding protein [Ramlibacter rhizophilus]TFZ04678.1 hypothetical protein EZ242_02715 [Ramlibacter rhizophilus]
MNFTAVSGAVVLALAAGPTCAASGQVGAQAAPASASGAGEAAPVETRATVRSWIEDEGGRLYVHLKIVPRAKLPFTTLRFRVRDRRLLDDLREGTSVKFRAERIEGENTLVTIRAVPPCERFQRCD